MNRRSLTCAGVVVATVVARFVLISGAGGEVTGTVKVTGATSNADAVVYVQQAPGTPAAGKTVQMDQRKMQFIPHVLPVVVGTTVKFLNSDPTPHNVFSPDNDKYNLGTWPQGQTKDHTFASCPKPPCVYTQLCRVHPEMEGYVVVLQNPYFAVTDKDGRYRIEGVPPGNYTVGVWHSKAKSQPKPVAVDASKPVSLDFVMAR